MSGSGNSQTYNLFNLLAPASGTTHGVKYTIALTAGATATINWPGQVQQVGAWVPQAAMVDNTLGTSPLTMAETTYGWTRIIPAGTWRVFQFPAVNNPNFSFTSSGTISPIVSFFDWPAFPDGDFNPAVATGQPVEITGQPIEVTLSGTGVPPDAVSYAGAAAHTITAGGTSQVVFAAASVITGAIITNPNNATENLYVDPVKAAVTTTGGIDTSFELLPGQSFTFGPAAGAININAATTGHAFVAVKY